MGKIPQEKIDTVCHYFISKFDGCKTDDESISSSDKMEFEIEWQGSKKIVAITEEFFHFQDVQNINQTLDQLGLAEHLEVLDKVRVAWKKNHALLEEYY